MSSINSRYILAKYDVSGIQDYIFATNRLQEIAGASYQVTRVLEEFLIQVFRQEASPEEVILEWNNGDGLRLLEHENIRAEIIYIGGGNAVVLFRDRKLFCKTGEKLAIQAINNCQGLCLVAAYIETELHNFADDIKKLEQEMNKVKRNMIRQPVYSPFPVVEQDHMSYQPITRSMRHGDKIENMTSIQYQKRSAYNKIKECHRLFPIVGDGADYRYPEDMELLCRKHGEDSRIAIVHIDGNGMGDRINRQIQAYKTYSEGVPGIRRESAEIAGLFQDTYAEVLKDLWDAQVFVNSGQEDEKTVPFRPILLDGDDFTFLCRAELAVPVTAGFMMKLMQKQKEAVHKITACAGIALVHSHFPFRVAYSIAEEACSQAKNMWYSQQEKNERDRVSCYLDFQIIKGTEAELALKNKNLQKRPYVIDMAEDEVRGDSLIKLYDVLKNMQDWPSGRLYKIYRALQEGENAVAFLKREFESRGYDIDRLTGQEDWQDSPLFDALELREMCHMDLLKKFLMIQ